MRPLLLSFLLVPVGLGLLLAQSADDGGSSGGGGGNAPQLPVGQVFKQFEFPVYDGAKRTATFDAVEARGITLNRAETTDLTIRLYNGDLVTTTITSPKADLYVSERVMRTANTVHIVRSDMDATSQECNFNLQDKQYVLRTNVRVLLKHFDISFSPATNAPQSTPPRLPSGEARPSSPGQPGSAEAGSMLESPGSAADTNAAPLPLPSP